MLNGTKKLFPTEYKKFTAAMISAAEEGDLPVVLELEETDNISLKDMRDLFRDFINDTSLDISGTLYLCDDCGRLHLLLQVSYPEKTETILQ